MGPADPERPTSGPTPCGAGLPRSHSDLRCCRESGPSDSARRRRRAPHVSDERAVGGPEEGELTAPGPRADRGGRNRTRGTAVRRAPGSAADPGSAILAEEVNAGFCDRVPEAREVGVAARARRSRQLTAPVARRWGEDGSDHQSLQTAVAALEAEIRAVCAHQAPRALPAHGGRERCRAGGEKPVVTDGRDAEINRAGGLGGGCSRRDQGARCSGEHDPRGLPGRHRVCLTLYGGPGRASRAAALTRTDAAAAGGAPSAMSRSTARRNSTRSASRAEGAKASTAVAAESAGTPLATKSASTARGTVSGWRRVRRSSVNTAGAAPARSAAAPASSSGGEAAGPRASRARPRSAARRRTAATMRSPGAPLIVPSRARCTSGSAGSPAARAESSSAGAGEHRPYQPDGEGGEQEPWHHDPATVTTELGPP